MEVYPRGCKTKDLLAVSSGEDEGTARAQGRVSVEKGTTLHLSRERQYDEGQWEVQEKSGLEGGVSQHTKLVGNYSVGPKQSVGFQKNMGISGRAEGDKQVFLRDFKKWSLGSQTGKRSVQNLGHNLGTTVGQSPTSFREKMEWPIERNALDNESAKRTRLGWEKTRGTDNNCFVSLQRSKNKVGEENESYENTPLKTVGQEEINNSERGVTREEGRISREAKGK